MEVSIPDPLRLLDFWRQVEFFIPFNYDERRTDHDRFMGERELVGQETSETFWSWSAPKGQVVSGFSLYLGLFSTAAAEKRVQTLLRFGTDDLETEQRLQSRSTTSCMALLHLDEKGVPKWDRVSVSTFAWALGQLEKAGHTARLDFQAWLTAEANLKALCEGFRKPRILPDQDPPPLSPKEILRLAALLEAWCGAAPPGQDRQHRLVAVQPMFRKASKRKGVDAHAQEASRSEENDDMEVVILNSFHAQDLARIEARYRPGDTALGAYLEPIDPRKAIDLYTPEGRKKLYQTLWPTSLPLGRWPAEDHHALSLMQQFAVNMALKRLRERPGLFSINGPPGTGKTTLLRDLIADILVERASVLAGYEKADEAFAKGTIAHLSNNGRVSQLVRLRPELCGHEILVVSSNNTAVENISRELPQAAALGRRSWRASDGAPELSYLRPVAINVAARQPNGRYRKLDPDQTPWGLAAAVLGRKENRRRFKDNLLFESGANTESPAPGYDPALHQTLYEWLRNNQGQLDFAKARARFLKLKARVEARRQDRQRQVEHHLLRKEIENLKSGIGRLDERLNLLKALKPPFWRRWFTAEGRAAWRDYRSKRKALDSRRQSLIRRSIDAHARLDDLIRKVGGDQALEALERELTPVSVPASLDELEQAQWQIEGLWRDPTLDRLRAELFASALALHEAWLTEAKSVLIPNLFGLKDLLDGHPRLGREQALTLWQTLFMIVPVVSSTLASVASQFSRLEAGDLGWVLIDEAGQAPPQTVVGALWRARRAVVVGDPLQIEPVFTVPSGLVEALMKVNGIEAAQQVSPHQVSAQILADAANPYGVSVEEKGERLWLGAPLRVHRRCLDPMFGLANKIAYDGKMVQATVPPESSKIGGLDLLPSSWVQLGGHARDRQLVQEQVELVIAALQRWRRAVDDDPPVFVITPFRRIAKELKNALEESFGKAWVERHVGTVHTFQGKEDAVVWLVLGCDSSTRRSARWAAGKPNLLNVALTRARLRFYMIGDRNLWGGLPHFSSIDETRLPTIEPQAFLDQFPSEPELFF